METVDRAEQFDDEPELFGQAVDRLATLVEEALSLCDEAEPQSSDWNVLGKFRGKACVRIPWARLARRWRREEAGLDPAPLSLVARIARDHGELLLRLAKDPRRLLIRQREEEKIDKIQELDPHCLLDYVQRPGRTLAEKAGRGQRLLAITRRESIDTLENRVLRDLLGMSARRGMDFIRENHTHRSESRRVRTVERFRREAVASVRHARIAEASRLHGDVQPNYVLLRDSRYQAVWRSWRDLREEERKRRELWAWSRRLWADVVRGWLLCGLHHLSASSGFHPTGNPDAILRRSHDRGLYFLATSCSARFKHERTGDLIDAIHPGHFHLYPERRNTLARSGAEFALTLVHPKEGRSKPSALVLVYSMLPLSERTEIDPDQFRRSLEALGAALPAEAKALVVLGLSRPREQNEKPESVSADGRVVVCRYPVEDSGKLATLAEWAHLLLQ